MRSFQRWPLALAVLGLLAGCGNNPPAATVDVPVVDDVTVDVTVTPDKPQPPTDNPPPMCDPGQTRCGGACVDTAVSASHCGRCDNACPTGQVCRMGACAAEMMCMAGQTLCGSACVDTSTDGMNCGACGNACTMGQTCVTGSCRAPDCPAGQTRCGASCIDAMTDAANCGTCGNVCAAGQVCMSGRCGSTMMCMAGETSCGGACVNTMTDLNNCGACGNACPSGQTCTAGACRMMSCPGGQTLCGSTCVDTATDAVNCGVCGRSCATGQTCSGGMCAGTMMCPMGQTLCSGTTCADVQTDPANCGACGRACTAGQTCVAGACMTGRMMCPMGQTDCTPMAPAPTCVNTATDSRNCGACGTQCAMGSTCMSGACRCAMGQTLCGRACVNTMADNANCGSCGNVCPMGRVCTAGACACPTGATLCSGNCVNIVTDNANCGACGTVCAGGQTCMAGRCACPAGQTLCGTGAAARCVSTMTDRANCGMCGRTCSGGQSCVSGACACPAGQTLCGTGASATCVDLMTSASNCGRCANTCPAGIPCMAGVCRGTPPANDVRTGATVINLGAGAAQDLAADTTSARHDTAGNCACTGAGNDVFFTFTLTQPEVVYADTFGATWDTSLFLQDRAGNNLTPASPSQITCNDDVTLCSAGSLASAIVTRLNPGQYYLVLSGCSAGRATIHFQHLPAGNGPIAAVAPSGAVQTATGATAGTGTVNSNCCSTGPDNTYFWVTCPSTPAATFYASSCSTATGLNLANYDVEVSQYSALRPGTAVQVCNDDTGFTCGAGATMSSTIPATTANQGGLNTMIVDTCGATGGNYSVQYVLSNCTSGTRCAGACVDTASDETNCGGCNRRCAMGQTCVAGACMAVRSGETRFNPIAIAGNNFSSVVNTTLFRNDTVGSCGCTTGRDVFYSFTVTAPEVVYADTIGSSFDTSLFLQDSTGANLTSAGGITNGTTCNDDGGLLGCTTGSQSQILAQLSPGSYFLVVSGCGGGGSATVRFQRGPVGNGSLRLLASGSSVISGTTSGAGRVTASCCSGGPEDTFFWYTCPGAAARAFNASTCGRATWDTSLAQVSPGRTTPTFCNDDACGPRQSSVTSAIPAGPGLHFLYVDGCGSASGAYTAAVSR